MANAQLSRNLFYCAPLIKISLRHSRDYAIIYCIEVFRILTNVSMEQSQLDVVGRPWLDASRLDFQDKYFNNIY